VWFEGVRAVGLDDDALTIVVPNTFAEEYIRTRFKSVLEGELRSLRSSAAEIRLVVGKVAAEA
jgi:chromosomal replication initiator protein